MALSAATTETSETRAPETTGFWALALGSIGVVFGDIGTSPLYALQTALGRSRERARRAAGRRHGIAHHLGAADRRHRQICPVSDAGGQQGRRRHPVAAGAGARRSAAFRDRPAASLGVLGAAMFYRRFMIMPAISVLSAVEGMNIAAPGLEHYVVPLTVVILVALFGVQKPRHRHRRPRLRPGDAGVVRDARGDGRGAYRGRSHRAGRAQPVVRGPFPVDPRHHRAW